MCVEGNSRKMTHTKIRFRSQNLFDIIFLIITELVIGKLVFFSTSVQLCLWFHRFFIWFRKKEQIEKL